MIPATAYFSIFLVLVTFFSIPVIGNYNKTLNSKYCDNKNIALGLALFLTLFIGLRPVHPVFADMVGYAANYDYYSNHSSYDFKINGVPVKIHGNYIQVGSQIIPKFTTTKYFNSIPKKDRIMIYSISMSINAIAA